MTFTLTIEESDDHFTVLLREESDNHTAYFEERSPNIFHAVRTGAKMLSEVADVQATINQRRADTLKRLYPRPETDTTPHWVNTCESCEYLMTAENPVREGQIDDIYLHRNTQWDDPILFIRRGASQDDSHYVYIPQAEDQALDSHLTRAVTIARERGLL